VPSLLCQGAAANMPDAVVSAAKGHLMSSEVDARHEFGMEIETLFSVNHGRSHAQ
jgi:hypothetical protein